MPGQNWFWQLEGYPIKTDSLEFKKSQVFDVDVENIDKRSLKDAMEAPDANGRKGNRRAIAYFSVGSWEFSIDGFTLPSGAKPTIDQLIQGTARKDFRDYLIQLKNTDPKSAQEKVNQLLGNYNETWHNFTINLDPKNEGLKKLMYARVDLAASKGFLGIELDDMDRCVKEQMVAQKRGRPSPGEMAENCANTVAFLKDLVAYSHKRSPRISVGMKNGTAILREFPESASVFDFAIVEDCTVSPIDHNQENCAAFAKAFGARCKPVYSADYGEFTKKAFEQECGEAKSSNRSAIFISGMNVSGDQFSCSNPPPFKKGQGTESKVKNVDSEGADSSNRGN